MTQQPSPNNPSPVEKLKQFLKKVESKQNLISALGGITKLIGAIAGAIIFFMALGGGDKTCRGFLVYIPAESDTITYLEKKIDCYRDRIANNPKDAVAYTNLGEAERRLANIKNHRTNKRLNELEAAKKHHLTAQGLDPKLKEVKQGLELVNTEIEDLHQKKTWLKPEMLVKSVEGKVMTFNKKE
jgi:hypothetical protein